MGEIIKVHDWNDWRRHGKIYMQQVCLLLARLPLTCGSNFNAIFCWSECLVDEEAQILWPTTLEVFHTTYFGIFQGVHDVEKYSRDAIAMSITMQKASSTSTKLTLRVFISTHNFLTIFSQCESQREKNSAHIVTHNMRWHRNPFAINSQFEFSKKEGILP